MIFLLQLYVVHALPHMGKNLVNICISSNTDLNTRLINIAPVKYFGEAEFWLSGGKVILMAIVFSFTFVSMVGGNPQHDAYGFRYWRNPVKSQQHSCAVYHLLTSQNRAHSLNILALAISANSKVSLRPSGKPPSLLLAPNTSLWSLVKPSSHVSLLKLLSKQSTFALR